MAASATATGLGGAEPRHLDRELVACLAISGSLIVLGGLVAAVNSAAPFDHGSWLAAYMVLVGGVAQLLLGAAPQLLLPAASRSRPLRQAQLALWNGGSAIVAVGVFVDATAVVAVGSLVVLAALGCFARGAGPALEPRRRWVLAYRLVIAVLAISVAVGIVLSGGSSGS